MQVATVARTVVEAATRSWVFWRRLPKAFGSVPILVTPSAGLKFLLKPVSQADPILLRNVLELVCPGDIVWDIGANVGLFAFSAAARAGPSGQVIAFEPDAWLVRLLRRSAMVQPDTSAPVKIVPAAVASEVGLRQFAVASRSRASSALTGYGGTQMGKIREEHTVVALSLTWLTDKLPLPNVIKCDVEGAELEVFSDQCKVFSKLRPVIICEVTAETSERMTLILRKERYRLFDGERPLTREAETTMACWNTIGVPEELYGKYVAAAPRLGRRFTEGGHQH